MKKIFSLFAAVLFAGSMMAADVLKVTLDFTDNTAWQIPVGSTSGITTDSAYSNGTYTIRLAATTKYYFNAEGYLMLGKANSTLTLPAFDFDVTKIVVTGRNGASASTKQNIFVGETAVSTETTGATGVNEYAIAAGYQAAGNVYVFKVTSAHNTQITKIEVYGEGEGGEPVVEPAALITFGDTAVAKGTWSNGAVFADKDTLVKLTLIDPEGKIAIDLNDANFGTTEEYVALKSRLKTGGKSSASKNYINVEVAKDGKLYIMARTGSNSATDRNVVITNETDTIFNQLLLESNATVVPLTDSTSMKIYPVYSASLKTGVTYRISYPVNAVNFYGFDFVPEDEPVVEPEGPKNLGAKTIAEFLELKNTKDTCILTGVVSNIQNTTFGNFDLTDESGKVYVYGLLTPAGESKKFADLNVAENDTLTVLAIYNEFNGTPQAKNAIFVEVKKSSAPVVEPVNLGAKTIAEFLELKNTKDTCILTGVVSNIQNTTFGNFDLTDESGKVYVYGLLTPAGESKKFAELNVAENDTLTVLAIYNEFNGTPQAKNAIFVEVKKYVEPVVFSHELYGSETLPSIGKTWFANTSWAEETNSHAEIVNDYDINVVLVDAKAGQWQSQVFVNPGFTWEVGAYYKMEFDLATNNQLGGVTVKVNNSDKNIFYYSFPNDNIFLAGQTTHFVADSIYAMAEPTDGGQLIFSIGWCDANTEILISNIVITKYEAPVVAQDINVTLSSIENPGSLIWTDATATSGWWQIMGENDSYGFTLSNAGEIAAAPGTYTVTDLEPDYSFISLYGATDTVDVAFVDGSIEVAVSAEGIVTVNGTLVGEDGNNYIFNLTYKDPVAEKTVELNIPDAELVDEYAEYGLYGVYGYTADKTSYVQLGIWTEEFAGQFTEDDLDAQSFVKVGEEYESIFSANITVTPGATKNEYSITADLLCYNNTLYKVTMTIGAEAQGIENVDAAVKATKTIKNGQLIIEKAGVKYNAQGAVIRK